MAPRDLKPVELWGVMGQPFDALQTRRFEARSTLHLV